MTKISVKYPIIGAKVIRGKDWEYENQDGGEGNIGEIIKNAKYNWVTVKWPNNDENKYRIGYGDKYDLYFADETEALLQEAIERFPSGCSYRPPGINEIYENIVYDYPYFWRGNKQFIALADNKGCVYNKGKWATRTDVKEKRVEVFPGIYVGDIVVSLDVKKPHRVVGDMFRVDSNSGRGMLSYTTSWSHESKGWRLATQEEIEFFNNGNKNINDLQKLKERLFKEDPLITEAKKRYPVGTKFCPAHVDIDPEDYCIITKDCCIITEGYCIITEDSEFTIICGDVYSSITIDKKNWDDSGNSKYGTTTINRVVYYSQENKWAEIINQSNTNQNEKSINFTNKTNKNGQDNSNNTDGGKAIEVRRLSPSITIGDQRGANPISGRKCSPKFAIGHLSN